MKQKLLLQTLRREKTKKIPLWFMRQAGRYLPEYRKVKKEAGGFLQMCTNPKIAAEISLQPLHRFDLDAVIFFCDILTPLIPMGIELDFVPHPVIANPIKNKRDIVNLELKDPQKYLSYVGETLGLITQELPANKTLIGFGGAPFTLAYYLCGNTKTHGFSAIKKFCFTQTEQYELLMEKLTQNCYDYLKYQICSGAEVIQIFDSWASCFHEADYKKFVLGYVQKLIKKLKKDFDTPIIYYINGGSHLIDALLESGADALSLDWRTNIRKVLKKIKQKQKNTLLQGNLDPFHLFSSHRILQQEITNMVSSFGNQAWIFNVGQGLDKETPINKITLLIRQLRKIELQTI